jgi:3'-phosphoadenosine 5'-phosphosulfate sulfotransferase (PAPS reductase)/FAD synthetase
MGLIAQYNALPNWRQRWCTRKLKIEPYANWLATQQTQYDKVVSYVGLRADEEEREGGEMERTSSESETYRGR